jgi:hypothetical protein
MSTTLLMSWFGYSESRPSLCRRAETSFGFRTDREICLGPGMKSYMNLDAYPPAQRQRTVLASL